MGKWEVGKWEVGKWEVGNWEVGKWEVTKIYWVLAVLKSCKHSRMMLQLQSICKYQLKLSVRRFN